jgi:glycosyltransferase involved in cell wall biosynthesis
MLFVGPRPDSPGGIAQFASNLILSVQDHADVKVIGFRRLYPRWARAGRLAPDASAAGAAIPSTPILVPWLPWTWRAAAREVRSFRPDVVIAQWWHPLLGPGLRSLATRSRKAGAHVVFVCHNARPHERFPLGRFLTKRALSRADVLMALSSSVGDELRRLAPRARIEVLAHPPNLGVGGDSNGRSSWSERIGEVEGPIVLFFGHVRRYKGLEDLIAAMPLVREGAKGAVLVVAGRFFTPIKKVRAHVDRLGMGDAVRMHPGYVRGDEVADLFSCADVVALPYREASQSGIVSQAALYGKPVVATRVGGLEEAVGDRGILVPPADPAALAAGIVRALENPPAPPALPSVDWDDWRRALLGQAARSELHLVEVGEAS